MFFLLCKELCCSAAVNFGLMEVLGFNACRVMGSRFGTFILCFGGSRGCLSEGVSLGAMLNLLWGFGMFLVTLSCCSIYIRYECRGLTRGWFEGCCA